VNKATLKIGIIALLAGVVGLAVGTGWGQVRIKGLQKIHQAKVKELNNRLNQEHRRYTEGQGLRATLEEEKQGILQEAEKLRNEKGHLAAQTTVLKTKAESLETKAVTQEKKMVSLESSKAQLAESLTKTEAERTALDQKQRQTFQTLQEREKELKQLGQKYDKCAENNAALYVIGEDLIKRYEGKGVMTTIMQKEPFTQIRKVELERLVQDYRDRISQQKVE